MNRTLINRILVGFSALVIIVATFGQVSIAASNGGRTASDFLLIGLGAGATGMGGAYSAVAEGAIASYWNPAGLTALRGGEVVLGHYALYQDITLEHGTAAYQVDDRTTVAASVTFLNYGQIDGYDVYGNTTGDVIAYDWTGGVSMGYVFTDDISVGVTGKYISQNLDDIRASAFAVDIGAKYQFDKFAVAAAFANLGSDMVFESVHERLPTLFRVGLAIDPFGQLFRTSVDVEKRFYGQLVIRNGFEVSFDQQYFVRTGYNYFPQQEQRSFGHGLFMGVGARFNQAEFNYAFTPKDHYTSESLHRLSLALKFGR